MSTELEDSRIFAEYFPTRSYEFPLIITVLTASPHLHRRNGEMANIKTEIVFFPL